MIVVRFTTITYKPPNVVDTSLMFWIFNLYIWYKLCHDQGLDPSQKRCHDLSEVADKPTYVVITFVLLILAKNL